MQKCGVTERKKGDRVVGTMADEADGDEAEPLPEVERPPREPELNSQYAQRLAEFWYATLGPYRHLYRMRAVKAYKNEEPLQWSVRFRVEPDVGGLYFRRFHFEPDGEGGFHIMSWSEDPVAPEEDDFDPDDYNDDDDMETLEEEERIAMESRESDNSELDDLEAESQMSLEELLAKYGMEKVDPALAAVAEEEDDVIVGETAVAGAAAAAAAADGNGEADAAGAAVGGTPQKRTLSDASDTPGEARPSEKRRRVDTTGTVQVIEAGAAGDVHAAITARLLKEYFNPALYEEETDIYNSGSKLKKAVVRIGPEFQASLAVCGEPQLDKATLCELTWHPPPPGTDEIEVDSYVHTARSTSAKPGRATEAALTHLRQCAYSVATACIEPDDAAFAMRPWELAETEQFEAGLARFGKSFATIQRIHVPSRTVRAVVEYYYDWKRTERYNLFVAVYGGYKGIPRHKDLVRPGMPVDGFAGLRARRESEIEPDYEHSPALNDPPDVTAAMEEDASLTTSAPAATPSAATEVPPAEVAAVDQVSTST
eukprot:m.13710 g.13710  ORF g.13710 m.13710 type:complete len:541 (+) comp4701_c0_seq1:1577-3199(+)